MSYCWEAFKKEMYIKDCSIKISLLQIVKQNECYRIDQELLYKRNVSICKTRILP
jgi:hypothetical protein